MVIKNWQLQAPTSAIVFDCDGTLTALEGVDELARNNGVFEKVSALTAYAMGVGGLNPQLYQERLDYIYPHRDQVAALGKKYFQHRVPDVKQVIQILENLGKEIYIVSAGLSLAVTIFAELLDIPRKNIFAVDIFFDNDGNFKNFDKASPLIHNDGKYRVVSELKKCHNSIIHIGDGLNDFVTHDLVTRFIGYGGFYYRENLASCCDYYISTTSMAPLLPLVLTASECAQLSAHEQETYKQGIKAIEDGSVLIKPS